MSVFAVASCSAGSQNPLSVATNSKHRVGHDADFTYPPSDNSSQHQTLPGAPEDDFLGIHDQLKCTTRDAPVAEGMITNKTQSTNDYGLEVDFYPGTNEAPVDSQLARTYVQIYAVAPGETVNFSTAEPFGQSHVLSGSTFCRPALIQRQTSSSGSNLEDPPPSGLCQLLTTDEVAKVAGAPVRAHGSSNGNCSWEDANRAFFFMITQSTPVAPPSYQASYPAPCRPAARRGAGVRGINRRGCVLR